MHPGICTAGTGSTGTGSTLLGHGRCLNEKGKKRNFYSSLKDVDLAACGAACDRDSKCTGFEFFGQAAAGKVSCQLLNRDVSKSSGTDKDGERKRTCYKKM